MYEYFFSPSIHIYAYTHIPTHALTHVCRCLCVSIGVWVQVCALVHVYYMRPLAKYPRTPLTKGVLQNMFSKCNWISVIPIYKIRAFASMGGEIEKKFNLAHYIPHQETKSIMTLSQGKLPPSCLTFYIFSTCIKLRSGISYLNRYGNITTVSSESLYRQLSTAAAGWQSPFYYCSTWHQRTCYRMYQNSETSLLP